MDADLETLFERFRRHNDLEALAALFDRAAPGLLKVALHLAPDPAAAEDLLQETFLTLLQKARTFQEGRPLVPWLVGILIHRARYQHRTRRRVLDESRLIHTMPRTPEEEAEARELRVQLDAALTEIDEPYREVLRLHLQQELAPAQVARLLGRPPSTVRTQLQRGLAALRRLLPAGLLPGVAPVPLRGLAGVREAVLARAAGASPIVIGLGASLGVLAMKKSLLATVAATLALLCAGAWFALIGGEPSAPDRLQVEPLGALASGPKESSPSSCELPPADRTALAGAAPPPAAAWPVNPAQAPIPAEPALLVEVVSGGRPVPGAEVFYLYHAPETGDEASARLGPWGSGVSFPPQLIEVLLAEVGPMVQSSSGPSQPTAPATEGERIALLQERGRKLIADEEGKVAIPRAPWPLALCAVKGGLLGRASLSGSEPGPVRLPLEPVRELRIEAVDSKGALLAGVPLQLYRLTTEHGVKRLELWSGSSAKDAPTAARFVLPEPELGMRPALFLSCRAPVLDGPEVEVDLEAPGPVRIVVPPTGRVEIRLAGADAVEGVQMVALSLQPADGKTFGEVTLSLTALRGICHLPHVSLGLKLLASAKSAGHVGLRWKGTNAPGPLAAGETVTLLLDPARPAQVYTGRALTEEWEPLADALLVAEKPGDSPRLLRTDGAGGFRWMQSEGWQEGSAYSLTWWQATDLQGRPVGPKAVFEPPKVHGGGEIELGDVVLRRQDVIAAGRVLDGRGRPIPGAWVQVKALEGNGPAEDWPHAPATDAEGRFLVQGERPPGLLGLTAFKEGFLSGAPVEAAVGARDLVLTLRKGGEIAATLRVEDGLPLDKLRLEAWPREVNAGRMRRTGREGLSLVGLPPGTYRVALRLHLYPLMEAEGILVQEGETTLDPRPQGIDLRGRFRLLRMRVLDEAGRPAAEAWVAAEAPDGAHHLVTRNNPGHQGLQEFLVPAAGGSLILGASGCRPQTLAPWGEETRPITLRKGLALRLTLTGVALNDDLRPELHWAEPAGALLEASSYGAPSRPPTGPRRERSGSTRSRSQAPAVTSCAGSGHRRARPEWRRPHPGASSSRSWTKKSHSASGCKSPSRPKADPHFRGMVTCIGQE